MIGMRMPSLPQTIGRERVLSRGAARRKSASCAQTADLACRSGWLPFRLLFSVLSSAARTATGLRRCCAMACGVPAGRGREGALCSDAHGAPPERPRAIAPQRE